MRGLPQAQHAIRPAPLPHAVIDRLIELRQFYELPVGLFLYDTVAIAEKAERLVVRSRSGRRSSMRSRRIASLRSCALSPLSSLAST